MDVYSHFLAPWDSDAPRALTVRLQAIEGASLIHAMSQGQALKPTFIQGLKTVRGAWTPRRNRHADWTVAFEVLTSADSDLRAAAACCSSERPREFLLMVHEVLQGTASPAVRDDVNPIPAQPRESQPLGQVADTATKTEGPEEKPAPNKPPRKEPDPDESDPLRVLLRRAEFAPIREKLSLSPSYGTLPPEQLKTVTYALGQQLGSPFGDVARATISSICLLTGLSPERACQLPLTPQGPIHISLDGYITWDMGREFGERADPVRVPVPLALQSAFKQLEAKSPVAADTLGALCRVPTDTREFSEWLTQQERFLRRFGDPVYEPTHARLARSLGQIYVRETRSDLVATALALDFRLAPNSGLHYLRLPARYITAAAAKVYRYLGLGEPAQLPMTYVAAGSPDCPSDEALQEGWAQLVAHADSALARLRTSQTALEAAVAWNELSTCNALMFCILTAHRASRVERITWGAIAGHPSLVHLCDKDIKRASSSRLIPKTELLAAVIQWHGLCAAEAAQIPDRFNAEGDTLRSLVADGAPFARAAFFQLRWDPRSKAFRRISLDAGDLNTLSKAIWGVRANVGRKFWVSAMALRGIDRFLIRQLTFHRTIGIEPDSPTHWQIPREAVEGLRSAMEGILCELSLPAPKFDGAKHSAVELRSLPLPRAAKKEPKYTGLTQSRDIVLTSLTSLTVVDTVRSKLVAGEGPESPAAALLVGLAVLEGITNPAVLRSLITDPKSRLIEIAGSYFLRIEVGERSVVQPLQTPTVSLIKLALSQDVNDWQAAQEGCASWLRTQLGEYQWDQKNSATSQLLKAAEGWCGFNLPPVVVYTAERAADIGSLNLASLERLCGIRLSAPDRASPITVPRFRAPRVGAGLGGIRELVRKASNRYEPLGGSIKRAKTLIRELNDLHPSHPGSPTDAVTAWVRAEATLIASQATERIRLTSLATYLGNLSHAIEALSGFDDLREWDDENWQELHALAHQLDSRETGRQEPSHDHVTALRRFAHTLAAHAGYYVPSWLLDPQRRLKTTTRSPAACVWVGPEDFLSAASLLDEWLRERPLLLMQCRAFLRTIQESPLRVFEPLGLPLHCVTGSGEHLAIRPNAFRDLKTSASTRLVPISRELVEQFEQIGKLASALQDGTPYLFVDPSAPSKELSQEIVHWVSTGLSEAVGDPAFVLHASRGAAISHLVAPGWHDLFSKVMLGEAGPDVAQDFFQYAEDKWTSPARASAFAGHGSQETFAVHYFACWTAVRHLALSATLSALPVGSGITNAAGVTQAALRQARSRAARNEPAFDAWIWAKTRIRLPVGITEAVQHAPGSARSEAEDPVEDRPDADLQSRKIRYVARRILGTDPQIAAVQERLLKSQADKLEAISASLRASDLTRRIKESGARGQAADLRALSSPIANEWLKGCDQMDPQAVRALNCLLTRQESKTQTLADATRKALPALLQGTTLEFVFGSRHQRSDTVIALSRMGAHVAPAHRDLGPIPRVSVVRAGAQKNDVEKARLTSLCRLLTAAFLKVMEVNE